MMTERTGSDHTGRTLHDFRDIAHFVSDAIIFLDDYGLVCFMNIQAETLTGWTFKTAKGLRIDQLMKIRSGDSVEMDLCGFASTDTVQDIPIPCNSTLMSQHGRSIFITGRILTHRVLPDDAIGCVLLFKQDTAFLENVFDGIPDIIGIQDMHHNVIKYNAAGYAFLKISPEQAEGKRCFELIGSGKVCTPCATTRCIETGKPERVEKFFSQYNTWLDCRSYPIVDGEGSITCVIEHLRDITGSKLTEKKMDLFKRAVDRSSDAISMTTFEGLPYYQNETFHRIFSNLKDRSLSELFLDQAVGGDVLEAIRSGHDFYREVEIAGTNEINLTVLYRAYPIHDHDSSIIGMVNLFTDISEKKESERNVIESEKLHRDMYETSLACLWRTNIQDGRFIKANLATAQILGFDSVTDLIAKGRASVFYRSTGDRKKFLDLLREKGEVNRVVFPIILPNGRKKTLLLSARYYPEKGWIEGFGTDITEQKLAEEALILMKEDLRITLNSIGDAVIATDVCGRILRMNPAAEMLTGWTLREAHEQPLEAIFKLHNVRHDSELENPVEWILNSNQTDGSLKPMSIRARNGELRQISLTASPIQSQNGQKSGIVIVFRDITNEYRMREELRESEERFRNLAELLPVGLFETDQNLYLTFVNSEALRMFQYTQDEVKRGMNVLDLLSAESRLRAEVNRDKRFGGEHFPVVEYNCRKKDETLFPVLLYINPIFDDSGQNMGLRGVLIDITMRKEMEERLKVMSMHDALTNLYNRAFFESEMHRLKHPEYHPLGIVVCDIDGLKLINETMGHRKGDELLKSTAQILRKAFSDNYMIARIGGDEFAVLLPNTQESVIESLCHQIQKETDLHNSWNKDLYVSISVGYAVSSELASEPSELFKIADHNMYRAKLHQSRSSRSDIIQALVKTLEARDYVADGHATRLQIHVGAMGHKLGLSDARQRDLNLLCRFHDLGKVGIPDRILLKKGSLTPDEFREVKGHCEIGYRIALTVADLAPIADYILKHHEYWDGSGYPLGLKGEEIPIESRILAIVDTFDAMTHDRPYQKALSQDAAIKIMKTKAGTHFDPYLVGIFLSIIDGT